MNHFFPQNIIQTLFQSINCQYDHKDKNHSKGKYFSQKIYIYIYSEGKYFLHILESAINKWLGTRKK